MLHILVLSGFIILYTLAWILLQPTLTHKKRRISTLSLKISYLINLAALLAFIYFLTFYPDNLENYFTNLHFTFILFSIFIPTTAMFARRRVKKRRNLYNYLFSLLNLVIIALLILLFFQILALNK
jgi:cytochrome bd-type quinol oxidase subunit 2